MIFMKKFELAKDPGTVYTDATGRFPHPASSGMNYILVMYDYSSNAILAEPLKNRSDAEYLRAYEKIYDYLEVCGLKPTFNIMDNEASTEVKRYMTIRDMKYQLVEPHCHRANSAERERT